MRRSSSVSLGIGDGAGLFMANSPVQLLVVIEMTLKNANDLIHHLDHLVQRWDNRFQLTRSYGKQYFEGNASVVFELHIGCGGCLEQYSLVFGRAPVFIHHKLDARHGFKSWSPIRLEDIKVINARRLENWDKQLVFVADVQLMNPVQEFVPSVVRLQQSKLIEDIWSGPVYCSLLKNNLKVINIFGEGEMDTSNTTPMLPHDVACKDVQSGTEIVEDIAHQQSPVFGWLEAFDDPQQVVAGLEISIYDNAVRFSSFKRKNISIQVSDVLLGPLDF